MQCMSPHLRGQEASVKSHSGYLCWLCKRHMLALHVLMSKVRTAIQNMPYVANIS